MEQNMCQGMILGMEVIMTAPNFAYIRINRGLGPQIGGELIQEIVLTKKLDLYSVPMRWN